jgi:argininosuccinate synthase
MNIKELKNRLIVLLASGGLDTMTIIKYLSELQARVLAALVNLGQPGENVEEIPPRMLTAGAVDTVILDGRSLLAKWAIQGLVQTQAKYGSGYLLTTSLARAVKILLVLQEIKRRGLIDCDLAHGSTGKGNDQTRFFRGAKMLNPSIRVIAPWHWEDFNNKFGGREQMLEYCRSFGLELTSDPNQPCSQDENFLGCTSEGILLEYLTTATDVVNFTMGIHPLLAPDKEELLSVTFKNGWPTHINGELFTDRYQLIVTLNQICGRNGYGIVNMDLVEDRYFGGLKSRGVYEAPGLSFLYLCYDKILQCVLDYETRLAFDFNSKLMARRIYAADWFSLPVNSSLAYFGHIAQYVTGTITYGLYKGNAIYKRGVDMPHSLYSESDVTFEKGGDVSHLWAQNWLNVEGVLPAARHRANQVGIPD